MELNPTDIVLFGTRIQEVDVILTDLLWSVVNVVCFWRLSAKRATLSPAGQWFRYMFLLMGIAVLLGAFLGHGFQYALGYEAKYPGWIISMWGVACFERAAILFAGERVSARLGRILSVANFVELAIFHVLVLFSQPLIDALGYSFNAFYFVEIHAGYGLLVIALPLHSIIFAQTRAAASKYVLLGIGVAALALVVHLTNFYLHPVWFNYHDVSHVVLTGATLLYYQAAKRMQNSPQQTADNSQFAAA